MDPNNKKKQSEESSQGIDGAEKTLHQSVSQNHPEWINENGDCDACLSLEHELAAEPNSIPDDLDV